MSVRSLLFWLAAACCVVAELAILRSLLYGRARAAEQHNASDGARIGRASRSAEIAWAVLPAIGLLFVLYLTWTAIETPRDSRTEVGHSRRVHRSVT